MQMTLSSMVRTGVRTGVEMEWAARPVVMLRRS